MSEPIGVGDWVEAIDLDGVPLPGPVAFVVAIEPGPHFCKFRCGDVSMPLLVLSVDHGFGFSGWCPNHWRPLKRPPAASTLIETLLKQPAPTKKVSA